MVAGCRVIDDNHVSVNGKQITIVSNRDPTKLPWADMVSHGHHLLNTAKGNGSRVPCDLHSALPLRISLLLSLVLTCYYMSRE